MSQTRSTADLINIIKSIDNQEVIDEIYRLLEVDLDETVYMTNKDQKKAIYQGLAEIENGLGIDGDLADNEIDAWLEE